MSGTITTDRVVQAVGKDASIWRLDVAHPHNDCLKTPKQLAEFRGAVRPLLDAIKADAGQATELHILPAMPAAMAVELGRLRTPKADMPWQIYDQNNTLGGFVPTLAIPGKVA